VSLARDSFNSIVARQTIDVTEVMMRHSNMGRQAEMGPSWCPSGLVSRQLAEVLAKRNQGGNGIRLPVRLEAARAKAAQSLEAKERIPTATEAAESSYTSPDLDVCPSAKKSWEEARAVETPRPLRLAPMAASAPAAESWASPAKSERTERTELPSPVSPWSTEDKEERQPERQPVSARGPVTPLLARPVQPQRPMSAKGRSQTTFCWRPNEHSLQRNSFNSIVGKSRLDVTEVMIRDASMGRQAEMGPSWCPSGLSSRKMAEALCGRG